ncbi:uncharacterized protein [Palaemon carinicauda]|uniref:uncharacterized protein n=1 Tax=Palaemon carinicauda TaxID=392227 RepID=UPI0035B66A3C
MPTRSFENLDRKNVRINIHGEYLNNLRYEDDLVLISESREELQKMVEDLNRESISVGLKINMEKTKKKCSMKMQRQQIRDIDDPLEIINENMYLVLTSLIHNFKGAQKISILCEYAELVLQSIAPFYFTRIAPRRQSLGLDAINQLLEQFDSDVDDALEVDDISDDEFINVDELEQEVREEQEEQAVTQNPEIVALGNGDGEADDDVGEEEGVGASGSHVVPVSTITSPVPSTSRGPPPPVTVPVPQLTPVEERSRKRRRGDLQAARGSAITHIDAESVKGRDCTVWHRDPNATLPHMFTPRIEPGGPTSLTLGTSKVSDIFSLFLTDRMLAEVVLYSNERLALLRSHYHHKGNVALRDIDLRELKAFIGILIMTAVRADNHTPTWDMWNLTEGNPLYRCTMNERRFTLLVRVIRFDDSATRQERVKVDRLAPIRKLFDHVVTNCRNNYTPGPHLTVDEQLVPFRGRCPFKMYIPNKPAKYGIKIVLACDADTHYMCNAIAYLGKDTVQIPRGSTLGEVFTSDLVAPFQRSGRTVTTDNFFTTLPLALSLLDKDMYLCGTIRQKPYIPKELTEKVLPPKESVAVFNYEHNLTLQCQQISRTKKVMLLSSLHHDPSEVEKRKTDIQMFYNATKGGVDTFDQMCSTSSCIRKSRRWPMTLFYGILNIIMVNSYILYTSMPFTKPVPKKNLPLRWQQDKTAGGTNHLQYKQDATPQVARSVPVKDSTRNTSKGVDKIFQMRQLQVKRFTQENVLVSTTNSPGGSRKKNGI